MSKYKSKAQDLIRFDYEGKEKIIEPGHTYKLEPNDFIEGLIAFGLMELVGEPEPEVVETPVAEEKVPTPKK